MDAFATINDLEKMWRKLKPEEIERATKLLDVVSDSLREQALNVGKNLDEMVEKRSSYSTVVCSVTVDVVARTLMTSTEQEPMTQASEAAMGYSWSGSYLVPGGGLFIKNSELTRLGLRKQRYGVIEPYDTNPRHNRDFD